MNRTLTSIKEPEIVEARSLHTVRERQAAQKFLVEGEEQISWVLRSQCPLEHVFVHDKLCHSFFVETLKKESIPLYFVSEGILKKITDTSYLTPFVGVAKFPGIKCNSPKDFLVVLDQVNDFGNLGTIVRTAQAFGIKDFISTQETKDLFHKKTIDASRGSVFSTHLKSFSSGSETIQYLKEAGFQIAVMTPHDSTLQSFATIEEKPIALVLGNETHGASQELLAAADVKIQIPMNASIESLNVGVAAGISLYELKMKWILKMLTQKIQSSLGRHLSCASKWMRQVFDTKLKQVCPFNANQAILLMILHCDKTVEKRQLASDAGLVDMDAEIAPLIAAGLITQKDSFLSITEKAEETLAKIWSIHELSEQIAFEGFSEEEKHSFSTLIEKIYKNCETILLFESR